MKITIRPMVKSINVVIKLDEKDKDKKQVIQNK